MWPWKSTKRELVRQSDAVLGELQYEDGTWKGKIRHGDHELDVFICGDSGQPDFMARKLVVDALPHLGAMFASAADFQLKDLSAEELAMGPYVFHPTGIWSGAKWQLDQLSVTLTMALEGDEVGLWRVEMGPNGPLDCGRDS
jgi:hypothetical protein